MDLKSGTLLWPHRAGPLPVYPALCEDIRCDVAIIGAGLTGALVAYALGTAGVDVVLLDKRDVARGSTSASTALILYEIDTPLFKLVRIMERRRAERSYRLCRNAIDQIENIAQALDTDCGFKRRQSLYLASRIRDVAALRKEYAIRKKIGLKVKYLSSAELQQLFALPAAGAILSVDAAEIDPFLFTHCLVHEVVKRGGRVFTGTEVREWHESGRGVLLRMSDGHKLVANRVVVAAGYESQRYLRKKLVRLKSTYAIATHPIQGLDEREQPLIWETALPYHYLRTTSDRRIIIGGEDEEFNDPKERDRLIPQKTRQLEQAIARFQPGIKPKAHYAWAGTFGETKDGLPYIGPAAGQPRIIYALCYGANGTNFAMIAANIICDRIRQKRNRDARIFSLDR